MMEYENPGGVTPATSAPTSPTPTSLWLTSDHHRQTPWIITVPQWQRSRQGFLQRCGGEQAELFHHGGATQHDAVHHAGRPIHLDALEVYVLQRAALGQ